MAITTGCASIYSPLRDHRETVLVLKESERNWDECKEARQMVYISVFTYANQLQLQDFGSNTSARLSQRVATVCQRRLRPVSLRAARTGDNYLAPQRL